MSVVCWWFGNGGTPVLIPNTEVKLICADDTSFMGESRSPPTQSTYLKAHRQMRFYYVKREAAPNKRSEIWVAFERRRNIG